MKDSAKYAKIVEWSDEDRCYVGSAPGLIYGGCHGDRPYIGPAMMTLASGVEKAYTYASGSGEGTSGRGGEAARRIIMKYRVIIEQDEDGVFVAEVPALPGCFSQGRTRAEALKNVQEAIEAYLESLKAHDEPVPPSINEEVVEVAV